MPDYSPIALFVYKRLDLTRQTIAALQKNRLAGQTRLYIFSDAAKSAADAGQVAEVREYISHVTGFAEVTVIEAETNQGCAKSVIAGVSKVLEHDDRLIVVEDDLLTTPNFLDYMNAALDCYAGNKEIFSIAGWSMALHFPKNDSADVFYLPRICSWGWGIWKNRWQGIDWEVADYALFRRDKVARKKFNLGGADLSRMLDLQMRGKIDSWAIRWCYAQYKLGMLTVFPKTSKVKNIGFETGATHAATNPNYPLLLDDGHKTTFHFSDTPATDKALLKEFGSYFSLRYRIKNRIRNYLAARSV